ncbi:MAG TPA: hypothetical protein VGM64_17975 [Lacunisphaera sp.]|jgi:hypothetical protein
MRIDTDKIHLVTYCVDHDAYELSSLSAWIKTDTNLFSEKRKHSGETHLILSAYSTPEEALAEAERLQSESEE